MNVPRFIRRLFREPFDGLRHHATVEEGVLYRSGQPTPDQLDDLIQRHGLRTVVCLRGRRDDSDPDAWERDERAVCERHGVEFVLIPFNHKNPPSSEQVGAFLELMRDPARRPVLLHCRLGQQRTGLFCALYRMHLQNVSSDQALREMESLGFGIARRRHRRLLEAFKTYAPPRFESAGSEPRP